jgi:hypothetical protein
VFRLHQKQIVDFTPGRAHAHPRHNGVPKGMPRSRWIRAYGLADPVVEYFKPARRPDRMSEAEYRALPESIVVRELRYRVEVPGFRTREVTLATTLLDEAAYPADALAELYGARWRVELFFKELKSTLGLDRFRFREFAKVETWVQLLLATFLSLEWVRARQLRKRSLTAKQRAWRQAQRTHGLSQAVRQSAEQKELELLADALETPGGRKRLSKILGQSHPKEYRMAI